MFFVAVVVLVVDVALLLYCCYIVLALVGLHLVRALYRALSQSWLRIPVFSSHPGPWTGRWASPIRGSPRRKAKRTATAATIFYLYLSCLRGTFSALVQWNTDICFLTKCYNTPKIITLICLGKFLHTAVPKLSWDSSLILWLTSLCALLWRCN